MAMLKLGIVSIGDIIELSSPQPQNLTVADLSRLLLSLSIDDVDKLKTALAIPALGQKAAGAVRRRITLIEDRERLRIGRWRGWRRFSLAKIDDEIEGVRVLPPAAGGRSAPGSAPAGDGRDRTGSMKKPAPSIAIGKGLP